MCKYVRHYNNIFIPHKSGKLTKRLYVLLTTHGHAIYRTQLYMCSTSFRMKSPSNIDEKTWQFYFIINPQLCNVTYTKLKKTVERTQKKCVLSLNKIILINHVR